MSHMTDDDLNILAPKKQRQSQADKLVELADDVELFHHDIDQAFASVKVANHMETWAVQSKGFRRWLSREFWNQFQKTA